MADDATERLIDEIRINGLNDESEERLREALSQPQAPDRIPDETRAHLHDLADYYSRSVFSMFGQDDYVLPNKFRGYIGIDMRQCAEAAYWWGVGAVATPEEAN